MHVLCQITATKHEKQLQNTCELPKSKKKWKYTRITLDSVKTAFLTFKMANSAVFQDIDLNFCFPASVDTIALHGIHIRGGIVERYQSFELKVKLLPVFDYLCK